MGVSTGDCKPTLAGFGSCETFAVESAGSGLDCRDDMGRLYGEEWDGRDGMGHMGLMVLGENFHEIDSISHVRRALFDRGRSSSGTGVFFDVVWDLTVLEHRLAATSSSFSVTSRVELSGDFVTVSFRSIE